jgi:hypothetical protein
MLAESVYGYALPFLERGVCSFALACVLVPPTPLNDAIVYNRFMALPQGTRITAEYIWIGGSSLDLRSKTGQLACFGHRPCCRYIAGRVFNTTCASSQPPHQLVGGLFTKASGPRSHGCSRRTW